MATIAPPLTEKSPQPPGGNRDGFDRDASGDPGRGQPRRLTERRYYTGMMLALAAIFMIFAAFTSALVVRSGLSDDWVATALPGILWPNTLILLASSFTLEKARRGYAGSGRFQLWWGATTVLGAAFLTGQILAWQQLAADWKFPQLERLSTTVTLDYLDAEIDKILGGRQRGRVVVDVQKGG